jgi:hypothetical protein
VRRPKTAERVPVLKLKLGELRMKRIYFIIAIMAGVAVVAGAVSYRTSGGEKSFLAADFNDGDQNRLGGKLNVFKRAPSEAEREFDGAQRRGPAGRGLRICADRKSEGFCGMWMHFFDMNAAQPSYFDARNYRCLSFWVKGEEGGESFTVKLADKKWIAKQDSIPLGPITDFLPGGVTTEWQEVLVPLHTNETLDWHQLGGLTLDFDKPGQYTVYVDDVSFKHGPVKSSSAQTAAHDTQEEPVAAAPKTGVIVHPANGANVSRIEELRGNLAPDQDAVVLVRCAQPNSPWWVQEDVERSGERGFKSIVRFGNDKTPPGTEFQAVVILPPTAEATKEFRAGDTLKALPDGIPRSSLVQVVTQ